MQIKLSRYIADKLVELGIEHGFSVVGGGAMHLNEAFGHKKGLTITYNHHEQASAMAAECYARINNKPALLCLTTGPGGTNAITGVVGGWLDSIPMIVISGQIRYDWTKRSTGLDIRALGDQEFDICTAISSMTKYCEMVIDPMRIRYCIEKMFYLAQVGRPGPTWLDIPLDVQGSLIETDDLIGFDPVSYEAGGDGWASTSSAKIKEDDAGCGNRRDKLPDKISDEVIEQIIDKIKNAKRPIFNAGNGIRIGNAFEEFVSVKNKLGIPVVVGWDSEDLVSVEDRLYAGRPGNFGDRAGNFAVQNADLVFSVGSRLSVRQVGYNYKGWAREAYTIVNDIDEEELKKPTVHISMPVHADCKDLLKAMDKILSQYDKPLWSGDGKGDGLDGRDWLDTCKMWQEKYPVLRKEQLEIGDDKLANVYAAVYELSRKVPEDTITVVGNGSACVVGGHSYIIKDGQRFISNSAVASMGYDLPAAIGAYEANNDSKRYKEDIILLTGDGSIQMNIQELQTIIHHKMPIKIFIINNDGYHSIRQTEKNFYEEGECLVGIGSDSGDLSFPDMEKIAAAYGYDFIRASHNSELADAVDKTLAKKGPAICEFMVDADQQFEPKSAARKMPDGTITSPPLEDLRPHLPDEELKANMIIPLMKEYR